MEVYQTIIDFALLKIADAQWQDWLQCHDIGNLSSEDILIDTGRGEVDGRPARFGDIVFVKIN